MRFLAKICGLKTLDAIEAAIDGGATHLGFIFFEKSPRHITPQDAGACVRHARNYAQSLGVTAPQCVAVTVNADDDALDAIVTGMQPDMIQLHGQETPERAHAVAARYGLPLIKAFAVRTRSDLAIISDYRHDVDLFILDAAAPKGSELPGGNGVRFDWSLLDAVEPDISYMLSGGLNIDNAGEALAIAHLPGIDMSSGVESAPGVKDVNKIKDFLALLPLKAPAEPI